MDKQMIDEMAGDIAKGISGVLVIEIINLAKHLIDLGYRKIPENAVVLTKEEYNELCCSIGVSREEVDRVVDLVRKETAENFERLANERIAKEQGERDSYDAYRIDNKAKYDGDIVSFVLFEICKEITESKV